MFITKETQLKKFCSQIQGAPRLAVDVEFMREKTYFPIPALVQVASEDACAAVDALETSFLGPLLEVLHNPKTVKVLHAGKQDLEIFYQMSGKAMGNIFDTQVAASLLGFGAQVSLMKLVEAVSGVRLDKSESYTDWTRRPLSEGQIAYALNDVRYLLPAHDYLVKNLKEMGRDRWVEEEFIRLEDPALYELPDPENQYQRIKGARNLKPRSLAVLRELAAWREREARKRNRFLNAIVREETLLLLAKQAPTTLEALEHIRGLHPGEIKKNGHALLEAIQKGLAVPKKEWPHLPLAENGGSGNGLEGLLWVYAQHRGKALKLSPAYLASKKELAELVEWHQKGSPKEHPLLLQGWKKKLIGNDLLSLLEGHASLGIHPKTGDLRLVREKASAHSKETKETE